jgi:hypothetical protein
MMLNCRGKLSVGFALLCSLLTGCGVSDANDLIGTYESKYSFGTVRIVLRDRGQYEEVLLPNSDVATTVSAGTWRYLPNEYRVELTNYVELTTADGELISRDHLGDTGYASLPVEWIIFFGGIRLGPDEGNPYVKVQ